MNVKTLAALTLSASVLLVCAESRAADWPTFLGPSRDGRSPDTGLLKQWPQEGPVLRWKVENIGPGWPSVAVSGGCVYTTGNEGESQMLICLDEKSGSKKWRAAQGPKSSHNKYGGARATPTVDGDRIYLTGGDGLLTCHSAKDGRILWKKNLRSDMDGKGKGSLVCADLKTGATKWQERCGAGQVTWADGLLYSFADQGGKLALVDPAADGNRVKGSIQVAGTGNSWSHPVVVNGRLYVRYDTNLYCYDVKAK